MSIITSSEGSYSPAADTLIESGQGIIDIDFGFTGSEVKRINLGKVQLPIQVPNEASFTVLPGGWVAIPNVDGTATVSASPSNDLDNSDDARSTAVVFQSGNGAAIITADDTDDIYVRLNQINYPFHFDEVNNNNVTIRVVGANSILTESASV